MYQNLRILLRISQKIYLIREQIRILINFNRIKLGNIDLGNCQIFWLRGRIFWIPWLSYVLRMKRWLGDYSQHYLSKCMIKTGKFKYRLHWLIFWKEVQQRISCLFPLLCELCIRLSRNQIICSLTIRSSRK